MVTIARSRSKPKRYYLPTCLLEVHAEGADTASENHFTLTLDDPRDPSQVPAIVRGSRDSLIELYQSLTGSVAATSLWVVPNAEGDLVLAVDPPVAPEAGVTLSSQQHTDLVSVLTQWANASGFGSSSLSRRWVWGIVGVGLALAGMGALGLQVFQTRRVALTEEPTDAEAALEIIPVPPARSVDVDLMQEPETPTFRDDPLPPPQRISLPGNRPLDAIASRERPPSAPIAVTRRPAVAPLAPESSRPALEPPSPIPTASDRFGAIAPVTPPDRPDIPLSARSASPSQVREVQTYFNQRWQPMPERDRPLSYRLILGRDGTLQRVVPIDDADTVPLEEAAIPPVGEPFVSPWTSAIGPQPEFLVVLFPNGRAVIKDVTPR